MSEAKGKRNAALEYVRVVAEDSGHVEFLIRRNGATGLLNNIAWTAPRQEGSEREMERWAKLFAAAPALLAVCKGLVRYAESVRLSSGMGANQAKRLEEAKAAIAAAE